MSSLFFSRCKVFIVYPVLIDRYEWDIIAIERDLWYRGNFINSSFRPMMLILMVIPLRRTSFMQIRIERSAIRIIARSSVSEKCQKERNGKEILSNIL